MSEEINIKVNLARHFLRAHEYRKAHGILREAERLALQTSDYPYWAELTDLLNSTEHALGIAPPAEQELSDGGDEWPK